MSRVLRLGTRGSALATTQSGHVAERLAAAGVECELVLIKTEGDVNSAPLATIGGTGVFVTAVRTALLDGRVDVIVHSYKDLPTAPADGIRLVAVPPRANPFDALCARDGMRLVDLPDGATVGTGSPRRVAQLRRLRPDLAVTPIRGNVDTRLGLVASGALDAVVLARAGLERLDRHHQITELFDGGDFLPAPAQGALAVECRDDDEWFTDALASVDDRDTRAAALAERALLAALEAGCSAPVAALGRVRDDEVTLDGAVIGVDGRREIRAQRTGPVDDAAAVGAALAADLISRGAAELLGAARS
ncbi:hydroxymethylbilane synthase [Nakamurella deserti]|uniref:hydroxymethylbilane synthase n=1 Tax=Nakamurella deserti TaxID=2164074 RepID=UPI000DBE6DCD|nr:hydroxymethylbilane synthase [Nakamurella deserti]